MMLVKPLPRGAFLGAKFLGLAAMFAIALAAAGIACLLLHPAVIRSHEYPALVGVECARIRLCAGVLLRSPYSAAP